MAEQKIDSVTVSLDHWNRVQEELEQLRKVVVDGNQLRFIISSYGRYDEVQYIGPEEAMHRLEESYNDVNKRLLEQCQATTIMREELQMKIYDLTNKVDKMSCRNLLERIFNRDFK